MNGLNILFHFIFILICILQIAKFMSNSICFYVVIFSTMKTLPVNVKMMPDRTASSSAVKSKVLSIRFILYLYSTNSFFPKLSISSRCICFPHGVVVTLSSVLRNMSLWPERTAHSILEAETELNNDKTRDSEKEFVLYKYWLASLIRAVGTILCLKGLFPI